MVETVAEGQAPPQRHPYRGWDRGMYNTLRCYTCCAMIKHYDLLNIPALITRDSGVYK